MFEDRDEAGLRLAEHLAALQIADPVVYALPRGGVPLAAKIAERLAAPLDLLMVRKLGAPSQPELAVGAVVDGDTHETVFNERVLESFRLAPQDMSEQIDAKLAEIEARRRRYLGDRSPVDAKGRSAIVVDDGIATGATVRAALLGVKARGPKQVILAVPVAPADTLEELQPLVDRLVCLETPHPFWAVGQAYRHFDQVSDAEVAEMMARFPAPNT